LNALAWLSQQQDGFGNLPAEEKSSMMEFSLLWAFFEAKHLNSAASSRSIAQFCESLGLDGAIDLEPLKEPLAYWRSRYVQGGEFTYHFDYLYLRPGDNVDIVRSVLRGEHESPSLILTCLLTLIYRYRNNLFHGLKWAYGLKDQLGNFANASRVLMAVSEMTKRKG
jgi:hypothetical protein